MNTFLINLYQATGVSRVVDSFKVSTGESAELPLADVLVISRVLFAVVMIGFIGYYFDRIKQSLAVVPNEANSKDSHKR
jgi:hypothetical protein